MTTATGRRACTPSSASWAATCSHRATCRRCWASWWAGSPRSRPWTRLSSASSDVFMCLVFGVLGVYMHPQGLVQSLLGQLVGGLNPQQALDAPRVCIGAGLPDEGDVYDMTVYVEEGIADEAVAGLRARGHSVEVVSGMGRALFGRGQIIRWTVDEIEGTGVWSAGSDLRGDGAAYPAGGAREDVHI